MAYSFEQVFAADPSNPANVARNAAVTIFAPGDVAQTPLTLTTPNGDPLANPLQVNNNGFGSAFMHATLDRVAWAGGNFTGFFTSYEGMKAEAVSARTAAQTAATNAGTAAAADVAARIAAGEFVGAPGQDGSNVLPTDTAIKNAITTPGTETATALTATIDTQVSATADTLAPALALAGVQASCYGNSWYAADAMNTGPSTRAINMIAAELGVVLSNHAVSGYRTQDNAVQVIGEHKGRHVPGAAGVVFVGTLLNDLIGTDTPARRSASYETMRALVATLSASSRVESSTFTFGGTWTSQAFSRQNGSGGFVALTSTEAAYADISVPAGTSYVLSEGTDGVTVGGGFTFTQGARTAGSSRTNAKSATGALVAQTVNPLVTRLAKLDAGTVRATYSKQGLAGTVYGTLDALLPQSDNPPLIVIIKPVEVRAATHYPKADLLAYLREIPDMIRAEFGSHVIVIDPAPGWDPVGMLGTDQLHPTDAGMAHVKDAVVTGLRTELAKRAQRQLLGITNRPGISLAGDSFARADNATSLLETSEEGLAWEAIAGVWGTIDESGYDANANADLHIATVNTGQADGDTEATITGTTGFGLVARLTAVGDFIAATTDGSIFKYIAGVPTSIGVTITAPVLGSVNTMKLVLRGNQITSFINGVAVTRATDAFNLTATKHGVFNRTAANRFQEYRFRAPVALSRPVESEQGSDLASILTPEKAGAVANGVTNDYDAFVALANSTSTKRIVLQKGKTYKIGQSLIVNKALDLNGATLEVTGRLTVTSGVIFGGTVKTSDKILIANLPRVRVKDVTHLPTAAGSSGIEISGCSDIKVTDCTTVGGFRGINLINCDNFEVRGNTVKDANGTGAYGILATATAQTIHGDGSIHKNVVTDCMVGISLFGGEANSTKPGYIAEDYTLQKIDVHNNIVTVTDEDSLIGCIFATRGRYLHISNNKVTGGKDVGVDFEHCTDSVGHNNDITNTELGALAAIFGCKRIMFTDNKVTYNITKAGSAATAGRSWKNTSNFVALLRDSPEDITFRGNKFRSLNGTLGQFDLATDSKDIKVIDNDFVNCYMSGSNSTAGLVTGTRIKDNDFRFTININNPVIMHETVLDCSVERNEIYLAPGEVLESANRPYIIVRDFALANPSENVRLRGNEIYGGGTIGIGLHTFNPAIRAWVDGNITDRVSGYHNSGTTYTNLTYDRNYKAASTGYTKYTAHDNPALNLVTATLA